MKVFQTIGVLAVAALLLSGSASCGSSNLDLGPGGPADADKLLLDRGTEALNARRWLPARQDFTRLLDSYPQSIYRADAKLGVGDTYLGEGTSAALVFAMNEFREFLTFYPTNPRADYAQFQLAMVHYKQMLAPERDQTETREAIKEFQAFLDRYPTSAKRAEGQKLLREAKDRLDDSEHGVGVFYLSIRNYSGAVERFKALLLSDPGYSRKDALYFNLADALQKVDKPAEALPYYERLVSEFEQSQYLVEAKRRIAQLKTTAPGAGL